MFAVKPIGDKELQKSVCQSLGTDYIEKDLAYFAAELTEDRASVAALIGVCQFSTGKNAVIETLVPRCYELSLEMRQRDRSSSPQRGSRFPA